MTLTARLMRITLHAEDYPDFHHATLPGLRASRLGDTRFTASGLSIAEAEALLPLSAKFAIRPRTRAETRLLPG